MQPEQEARKRIDALLGKSGWIVQDRRNANPKAGPGVAVREFLFDSGEADYGLFVDGKAIGAVEAKKAGTTLSSVAFQTQKYLTSLPETFRVGAIRSRSDTRAPGRRPSSPICVIPKPGRGAFFRSIARKRCASGSSSPRRCGNAFAIFLRFQASACGNASAEPFTIWRIPLPQTGRGH